MRDELAKGMERFRAKAAASMILDVDTGEVVSLVSRCPISIPTIPSTRSTRTASTDVVGVYEMGSTFKALTIAMALDSGKANINSSFDARNSSITALRPSAITTPPIAS